MSVVHDEIYQVAGKKEFYKKKYNSVFAKYLGDPDLVIR